MIKKKIHNKLYAILLIGVIIFSCNNDKSKEIMNKKSDGELSENNKRIGDWYYYNDEGDTIASGEYSNGLKIGVWKYSDKTYNGSKGIDWDIYSSNLFKINIPNSWELNKNAHESVPLVFIYNDTIRPSGNITLIAKDSLKTLKELSSDLINDPESIKNKKILKTESIKINNLETIYSQQILTVKENKVFIEQYLIEGVNRNYLLSFFVRDEYISKYHKVFTEIAYSFSIDL